MSGKQDKPSPYRFLRYETPRGISVLAALYVHMMAYSAATMWRVLGLHGFGSPLANISQGWSSSFSVFSGGDTTGRVGSSSPNRFGTLHYLL
jgi:hypothetical protein